MKISDGLFARCKACASCIVAVSLTIVYVTKYFPVVPDCVYYLCGLKFSRVPDIFVLNRLQMGIL